jgi:hypothetical protein
MANVMEPCMPGSGEPRRCDFCLTVAETYWIAQSGAWVTCGACPGWSVAVRAANDAVYLRQMIAILGSLPEPEPWD